MLENQAASIQELNAMVAQRGYLLASNTLVTRASN